MTDSSSEAGQRTIGIEVDRVRLRAHRAARAHYLAAKRSGRMHTVLGIPAIALSAIVGTAVFTTISSRPDTYLIVLAGTVSLVASVLAALQTFFSFSERSEKHRSAGAAYKASKRQLDLLNVELCFEDADIIECLKTLKQISLHLSDIERSAPDVPDDLYDQARREQDNDSEGV